MKNEKITGLTWPNWLYIALILPNRVVFLKNKKSNVWERRRLSSYVEGMTNDAPEDSLWVYGEGDTTAELPEDEVEALWLECRTALHLPTMEHIHPTKNAE
jgi:hypothetical protein